jgi:hypothetical protein
MENDRKFHTVSFEDREMFAYNARYNKLQAHLAQPENRIRYSFEFMSEDAELRPTALLKIYENIALVEDQTAHY